MNKSRVVFVCQQCGRRSPRWLGKCPDCQQWNTFTEQAVVVEKPRRAVSLKEKPQELSQVKTDASERIAVTISEFDRVLGGGLVIGSLVLIGGEPGIGKSTLLLQASARLTDGGNVVYISGEESSRQISLRAKRLGIDGKGLYLLSEMNIEAILAQLDAISPKAVVVDSIQTVYLEEVPSTAGSVAQVRECTLKLMQWAKSNRVPVLISGHVTKDGSIAGPRILEHIVDVVLYLEGEQFSSYRLLRCAKNRFGSVSEVGIFEMKADGLVEVENPSQLFLSRHREDTIGSAVVPVVEGSRPLLVEIQALTNTTAFGQPRRTANGVDFGRLLMISAVLSRRAGIALGTQDIIASAAGGIRVGEPAADLAIALAIASSAKDRAVSPDMAAIGEVGLSGELRPVPKLERRLDEAARLGFKKCLVPENGLNVKPPAGLTLVPAGNIREAIIAGLLKEKRKNV